MSILAGFADRNSRHMKPETRKKLSDAKTVLRELYDQLQTSYGRVGAGHRQPKTKAKSRRNPR